MKRIIACVMSLIMLLGTVTLAVSAYPVEIIYEISKETKKPTDVIDYSATVKQYLTLEFATAEEKLESMVMRYEKDGYQLWVDELTGEVATLNLATGQILFSNPYDVGAKYSGKGGPSESTKKKLMSQIMIRYIDNDTEKDMFSFEEAAMRGQIKVKNIKSGIRIEYSIGREETRMLVPRVIVKERFESQILDPFAAEINEISRDNGLVELEWRDYFAVSMRSQLMYDSGNNLWFGFNKLLAFYQYRSTKDCATTRERLSLEAAYPITKKWDVYIFTTDATQTEMIVIENYIKTYCPSYTYEQLEYDHQLTEYEGSDKAPALFKLSLEYTLDKWGMSVRLPVNGLRFNESLYKLTYISVLPYMGAGANYLLADTKETFTGYNFFPDGSGTLFRHEELNTGNTTTINAKIYGFDYAYNNLTGTHAETVRYPVFGIVTNYHDIRKTVEQVLVTEEMKDPSTGEVIVPAEYEDVEKDYVYKEDRGYVAILEEGDALAELSTYHAGALSKYNSISMLFYPRPKDSYNLANAISVGANASWTVVSQRKYTGNYKIRYIMLTDAAIAEEKGIDDYYEVSWLGMARAYRDYLYEQGTLTELDSSKVGADVPAYIETFGTLETTEKIMSIPVDVMTPLTSFEDVKTMYDELSAEGVKNIKFKLTGYANGGMFASIPYRLKWEKSVGGASGFENLLEYAEEKGFQVFPDFDFAYVRASTDSWFDGLRFKDHIVKSINNTYMSKRYYSATRQTMLGRYELAVSAAYYSHFYEKLTSNYLKYFSDGMKTTISVASLGSALNSDFDEDEPYNREDTKKNTAKAFGYLRDNYTDVMTESANAYTWKYVDYIINLPLDSSRYTKSGASVPFLGVVLHGSKQYSGPALNMEGNIGYSLLKAIENGAGVYFTLCYQNYAKLKENQVLSSYYSVRYDILKEDVVKYYTLVNDLTRDLQQTLISSHRFLIGERVPDEDEIIADAEAVAAAIAAELKAAEEADAAAKKLSLLNGRVYAKGNTENALEQVKFYYEQAVANNTGAYSIDSNGKVTLTVGMKTLVEQVLDLTEKKNAAQEDSDAKHLARVTRNVILEAWQDVYNPYNSFMSTGKYGVYLDMIAAVTRGETTLANNQNTAQTRLETYEKAITDAVKEGLAKVRELLAAYKETPNEDTLAALVLYTGTVDNAEQYVYLLDKQAEAESALAAFSTAFMSDPEYKDLEAKLAAANEAYNAAVAEEADLVSSYADNPDYAAAKSAVTDANTALKNRISRLNTTLSSAQALLETLEPTYGEYAMLEQLITDTGKELAELQDAENVTNEYRAAVISAEAALAAYTPKTAAAQSAKTAASDALSAYSSNYLATYKTSAAYLSAEQNVENATAAVEAMVVTLTPYSPAKKAVDEFAAAAEARLDAIRRRNEADYSYVDLAEYNALKDADDLAAGEFNRVKAELLAGMEDNAEYKKLKAALDAAREELEKYTLGYEEKEEYVELKETYDELLNKFEGMTVVPESAEYTALKNAATAADAEYEAAVAAVADVINGKSTAQLTDAQMKRLTDAVEAKGKADAELQVYEDNYVSTVKATREYTDLQAKVSAAKRKVDNYISAFQKDLDTAAKESASEEKPLETIGGKYKVALAEYNKASNYFDYFTGKTKVPTTVSDATVYSTLITKDPAYVAADNAKSATALALRTYTGNITSQIRGTVETTDPFIKAQSEKYVAASADYDAANAAMTAAAAKVRELSPTLYSGANGYYTVLGTVITNEFADMVNKAHLANTGIKADYERDAKSYEQVAAANDAYTTAAADAETEYVAAAGALGTLTKSQSDAIKAVKTQISRVSTNIVPRLNYYVKNARTALADSNYAMEILGSNTDYVQSMRDDLAASHAEVVVLEAEIREICQKALVAAKEALEEADKIIPTDTEVADPYDDSVPAEEESGDGEEEEDEGYVVTKYTDQTGNIVEVGYANGVKFILNYNYFDVTVADGEVVYTVPAYGGIRFNADGTSKTFTAKLS